jgi:hypothetical protein
VSGLALALLLMTASARAETQRVEGLEFQRVEVFGDVQVEIQQGDANELRLRGDSDELAMEPFYVSGKTLVLGRSNSHPDENFSDIKYKLTLTDLRYLGLKGSSEVYIKPLHSQELHVVIEGSGDIKAHELRGGDISLLVAGSGDIQVANLEAGDLRLVLTGSGDIHLGQLTALEVDAALKGSGDISLQKSGRADTIEVNIAGSGDADFSGLSATVAEFNIVGSGTGRVGEVEALEVNILGSGDVYYRGEPDLERAVLGSGDLHQMQ